MLNDFPQLDLIAVGAHPDDVEIACGGTLASLVQQGYRVGIIDLTDGEPTPGSASPEQRLAEAKQAAETLGVNVRVTLNLPNRRLFDSFEARVLLATEFRKYRPRVVIGFGEKTPLASPDHWQAMQITDAAVFYARLSKWEEHFAGLPVHSIEHQLYFQLPPEMHHFSAGVTPITIEITSTLEQKLAAVRCYASQFPPSKAHIYERIRGAALSAGAAAGFTAGETLGYVKMLGATNLMQLLDLSKPCIR